MFELVSAPDSDALKSVNTGGALIQEILTQRRMELWGEGFRFFDLKRTNSDLDRTGANHNSSTLNDLLYVPAGDPRWQWKIPGAQLDSNPFISDADQNP